MTQNSDFPVSALGAFSHPTSSSNAEFAQFGALPSLGYVSQQAPQTGEARVSPAARSLASQIANYPKQLQLKGGLEYVIEINRTYDAMATTIAREELVQLRLMRSLWAKKSIEVILYRSGMLDATLKEFALWLDILASIRGLIPNDGVSLLGDLQKKCGDSQTAKQLALLLADFADPRYVRDAVRDFDVDEVALQRLGPKILRQFRPIRKCAKKYCSESWLNDADMAEVEFVDGDPDRIRVRGLEFRSGDIGIVELNYPGDGIHEAVLAKPGIASHAMLYVTRRVAAEDGQIVFQPCLVEIYEGGWRCVPITTGLSPHFSWYSEWVRPRDLPVNVGELISKVLDQLEVISFDFQSRRYPSAGSFPQSWGAPSATCTNLIRIIFDRAGITELPYRSTSLAGRSRQNLQTIGIDIESGIYTPTDILTDPYFHKVGIVDNGMPEMSYAQAVVLGRPELTHTMAGLIAQRTLLLENLPNWRSVRQWRSACESLKIAIGQSDGVLANLARSVFGYTKEEIPVSASDTAIAFYLRSGFVAGDITTSVVYPALQEFFANGVSLWLSQIQSDKEIKKLLREAIAKSDIEREKWYAPLV